MAAKSNLLELIGFYQYYYSTNSFSACHIACNFSMPQLKFSKAGQRCKYPNSPIIQMKRKWGKKNSFKAANLLGCKRIWQAVCLITLFASVSESCVAGVLRSWTNQERSLFVHVPVRFAWLILSLWELLGRGTRTEKVTEALEGKYRREKGNWRKLIGKAKDSMSGIVKNSNNEKLYFCFLKMRKYFPGR